MQKPFFCTANAAENAAKSAEARRKYAAERQELAALRSKICVELLVKQSPYPTEAENYLRTRIARVRKQLDKVDEMLADETDPAKLDKLVSAAARLSEVERKLSMRPEPGSLKPRQEPLKRSRETVQPLAMAQPEPVAQAQVVTPASVSAPHIGPENG